MSRLHLHLSSLRSSSLSSVLLLVFLSSMLLLSLPSPALAGSTPLSEGGNVKANCTATGDPCQEGVVLPVWNPQNPSVGDKVTMASNLLLFLLWLLAKGGFGPGFNPITHCRAL